jgi:hypothetical protein
MHATGGEGDLELACQQAIDGSLRLYNLKDARTPRRTVNLFKKQSVASVT